MHLLLLRDHCSICQIPAPILSIAHAMIRWLFKVVLLIDLLMHFVHYVQFRIVYILVAVRFKMLMRSQRDHCKCLR
ncbi:hypothetical protein BRARA_H01328 [Brassica rapa]|uniref:Uncharacterized protein n=1 Tax=Brassica campestris TaxID=3711 RepID=A0A397YHX4_BRACM|nr:hypothetical protein BRARA_H01328 [Brassica rapa]